MRASHAWTFFFKKRRPLSTNRTDGQTSAIPCGSRAGTSSKDSRHPPSRLDTRPKCAQMPPIPFVSRGERHFVCLVTVELGYTIRIEKCPRYFSSLGAWIEVTLANSFLISYIFYFILYYLLLTILQIAYFRLHKINHLHQQ